MAKEAEAAPAPKKSKKLLIIIALVVVLLLGGGGAAFFLMKGDHEEGDEEEAVVEKAKPSKKKAAKEVLPTYIALDAFTVNLTPENGEQFMQLMLSIEVEDAHVGDKVKAYTPKIRNDIMLLLSGKKASDLAPKEGKEKLAGEIRELINGILAPGSKNKTDGPVTELLCTPHIIQ